MMTQPMLIEIEHQDEVCIFRIKGRFVAGADPELLRAKRDEIGIRNCKRLLVDLRDVPFIGSTGIGFLVGLYTSITRNPGGRFVLVGPHPRVREVLELTRLNTIIPMAADFASGLAVLRAELANAKGR